MSKKQKEWETLEIIDDDDEHDVTPAVELAAIPKKRVKKIPVPLKKFHFEDANIFEIGVDEVGRGPLFGRVYTAAVILPKDDSFDHLRMKDSKLFHSKKKIQEVAEYIKQNAITWAVSYEDEKVIDEINILQATQRSMHKSISMVLSQIKSEQHKIHLLIDGNYFNSYTQYNKTRKMVEAIPYTCIEGGDNKYSCIAAASILAKVARDEYIDSLCETNIELIERYGINTNKGYGAKKHLEGIKEHGITIWHRRSFGICKQFI
jgi:ribonuclease HII